MAGVSKLESSLFVSLVSRYGLPHSWNYLVEILSSKIFCARVLFSKHPNFKNFGAKNPILKRKLEKILSFLKIYIPTFMKNIFWT